MQPFTDAYMPEVIARVAAQLVVIRYRNLPPRQADPRIVIEQARQQVVELKLSLLDTALSAMWYASLNGMRVHDWKARAVYLSRYGCGFRRCWYDDYKANRRS